MMVVYDVHEVPLPMGSGATGMKFCKHSGKVFPVTHSVSSSSYNNATM